jgi:hypothetical protein
MYVQIHVEIEGLSGRPMNAREKELCRAVLGNVLRRPVAKLFWSLSNHPIVHTKSMIPLSFSYIVAKLNRNLYHGVQEWIDETDTLLDAFISPECRTIQSISAAALKAEFHSLLDSAIPGQFLAVFRLKKVQSAIQTFAQPSRIRPAVVAQRPAAEFFSLAETTLNLSRLQRDIQIFKSLEVTFRIAAFLSATQPETVLLNGREVSFEFPLMTLETATKLRHFIDQLFLKIVAGEIDPFHTMPTTRPPSLFRPPVAQSS